MCYCNNAIMTFAESNDNRLDIEKEVYSSGSVLECTVVKRNVCHYCTLIKVSSLTITHQSTTMTIFLNPYIFRLNIQV